MDTLEAATSDRLNHYKALDSTITKADASSLKARWNFGRLLIQERIGRKLPVGRREAVAKAIGKCITEIKYRMLFAQKFPTEGALSKLIKAGKSWHDIVAEFGMDRSGRMERRRERKLARQLEGLKVFNAELPENLARVECARMEDYLKRPELLGKVDAIITDPPYGKGSIPLYGDLARLAKDCLKPDGVLAVMAGQYAMPEILAGMTQHLPYRWTMAYVYPYANPSLGNDRKVNWIGWKPVFIFGGSADYFNQSDVVQCQTEVVGDKSFHKWGQSLDGFKKLVETLTQPGQLVVDPFMGAGTTGLAALALKRRFAGCDIDNQSVEISRKRIGAALAEATLAPAEGPQGGITAVSA